ncbi:TPA: multicopper oxidase domain-containing protein [Legionella pneumophila]|uniref:Copper efflux ATPase n=1 Tax=Legionella santicrucis TaxID=45074 RepID=A0A0W0Z187_9GAMM|nr:MULTISPECIES: multicopper oxidase domain-containing protein [Legionellaceae]HAU0262970.1 multicopper oxidase domain-containing protein [Legionella pneumophila]KTD62889.1 copper efflux ATPase [Legionella santicrucis]HAU0295823.1 multicopper oxidase domain-containing protein [Legionella pneumophila]HAU0945042.1 multicopper oxidase domain-containing protein [Legionella pneumophila]HAU0967368.1 multicopper oxidase domain-containing protein [Legionella pneumophila]
MLKKDFHHVLRNYFLIFFLLVFSPFALFAQHEQHGAATPTETSSKTTLSQSKPTGKKTEQQPAKKKPARAIKPLSLPRGPARTINLVVAYKTVYFAGKPRRAIAVNGRIPAPTLHFKEGEQVTINVYNHLDKETSIHWHGLLVPWQMDGVEDVSQKAIPPGGVFHYRFTLYQRGTYWYHAHAKAQEQEGLYGAFLIDPPSPPAYKYSKDHVVVLSDWSNTPADNVFANLKKDGDYYSPRFPLQPSLMKFLHDYRKAPAKERKELIADYKMMQQMRMSIYDLSDIAYDAYLLNGQPKSSPWTAPVRVGDTVRLRFIGAGASTIYRVKIPDAKMEMVHSQGNDVRPYLIDDFWIAPGETYDVLVKIQKNRPYIIYAESIDTLGKVYGALVTKPRQPVDYQHIVPFPEPLPVTREMMANMMKSGMNHGSMAKNNHSMSNKRGMAMKQPMAMPSHSKTMSSQGNQHNMPAMTSQNSPGNTKHSNHSMSSMKQDQGMSGMNHASILKNKMSTAPSSSMNESTSASRPMKPKGMPPMSSMSTGSMGSQSTTQTKHATMSGDGGMQDDTMNNGMSMDNGMTMPIEPTIIGDTISAPNSISAKTLGTKYQQLTAAVPTNNPDIPVDGIIRMELFGYMDRYIWMINGLPEYKAKPIVIEPGKRYRIIFTNNSMMRHPMHIHGHWFILRNGHGVYDPLLHTIEVDPGATAVADFDTEASGQWFFHCHHLFHMTSGMARVFQYETIIDVVNGKAKPETEIAPTPYINRPIVRVDEVMPIDKALITHPAGHHQGFYRANFLEVNADPFHNAQEMTFRGYYGTDYQKLQLYTEDAEIYQGIVENADIDVFYWHLISQFWAIKGGVNYFYRPGGPYWQPGIGIEGLMPYYIDTNIRTYYRDGSVKFDIQLSRATQLTNNFFFLTGIRSILATHTVVENEIGSGLNQMRYIIRPYYRVMPGLNVFTEFEYDKDYGAYKRILTDLGESTTQTTVSFGVAVIF